MDQRKLNSASEQSVGVYVDHRRVDDSPLSSLPCPRLRRGRPFGGRSTAFGFVVAMLGSMRRCPNCTGSSFERTPASRATQCSRCHVVLEERARSALPEYRITSVSEELHCAVTPDMRAVDTSVIGASPALAAASSVADSGGNGDLAASLPEDPYATPGFISAFRVMAPLQEPVFGATASTMSGALSEMERLLGGVLHQDRDSGPRPDARHAVAVYFEVLDLANVLDVDRETSNLAIRLFCHTAATMVIRNKQIEPMAAASLHVALHLRHTSHRTWRATRGDDGASQEEKGAEFDPACIPPTPEPLTAEKLARLTSVSIGEIIRYVKYVQSALKSPPAVHRERQNAAQHTVLGDTETPGMSRAYAASFAKVPGFAADLQLGEEGIKLANAIVERAYRLDACPRRAPASVSAACIYLTCQIMDARLTQAAVCRVMQVTEVTLRKVYKELCCSARAVVPEEYSVDLAKPPGAGRVGRPKLNRSPLNSADADDANRCVSNIPDEAVDGAETDSSLSITQGNADVMQVNGDSAKAEPKEIQEHKLQNTDAQVLPGSVQAAGESDDDDNDDHGGDEARKIANAHEVRPDHVEENEADIACEAGGHDNKTLKKEASGQPVAIAANAISPAIVSPSASEQYQQEQQLLAMMQKNPAAVAAFAKALSMMPNMAAAPTPPAPPPLPNTKSAKSSPEAASPISQASPGTLDASTINQVRTMMESIQSQEAATEPAHFVAPPPPPALPPKRAASTDSSRQILLPRQNDNTSD